MMTSPKCQWSLAAAAKKIDEENFGRRNADTVFLSTRAAFAFRPFHCHCFFFSF